MAMSNSTVIQIHFGWKKVSRFFWCFGDSKCVLFIVVSSFQGVLNKRFQRLKENHKGQGESVQVIQREA